MNKHYLYIVLFLLSMVSCKNRDAASTDSNTNSSGLTGAGNGNPADTGKNKGVTGATQSVAAQTTITATSATNIKINNSNSPNFPERPYYVKGIIIDGAGMNMVFDQVGIGTFKPIWSENLNEAGGFGFEGTLREPALFQIRFNGLNIQFVVRPNDTIEFYMTKDDLGDFKVVGSPEPLIIRDMWAILDATNAKIDALHLREKKTKDPVRSEQLTDSLPYINDLIQKEKATKLKALITKADTNFTALLASLYLNPNKDLEFMEKVDEKFKKYSDNEFYVSLHNKVMTLLPVAIGHYAPDIGLPDTKGNTVKISSMQGKYTLLYFWASNNANSRIENKNVAKLYDKYKSRGLQLYGISLDDNKNTWLTTLNEDKLEGVQVCDLLGYTSVGAQVYLIANLPTTFILDPSGKIIDKGLYDPELESRLSKLIK